MTLHLILLNFCSYYASPQGHPNYSSIVVSSQFPLALKMTNQVTREILTRGQSSAPSPSGAALVCIHQGIPIPLQYQLWLPPPFPSPHTVLVGIPISVLGAMPQHYCFDEAQTDHTCCSSFLWKVDIMSQTNVYSIIHSNAKFVFHPLCSILDHC